MNNRGYTGTSPSRNWTLSRKLKSCYIALQKPFLSAVTELENANKYSFFCNKGDYTGENSIWLFKKKKKNLVNYISLKWSNSHEFFFFFK